MAYRVEDTDTFRLEYSAILLYLVDVLETPAAANNLFKKFELMQKRLSATPEICAISTKPALENLQLREYFIKNYVVLYRIEGSIVYLEHIFHGKQNYEAYV